jgi:hypothetical protein
MKLNSVKKLGKSELVQMGPIELRQPIPSQQIAHVDPFLLFHHYGPYDISEANNPFDLGPHPHRGFEPITFLIQGEQLHRDSLGNSSVVKAGDVQWTTAGRGIIHSEVPSKEFVSKGGMLEGIQLWLNLPATKKMIPAKYQHVQKQAFQMVTSEDGKVTVQIIAGAMNGVCGKIQTETPVHAFMLQTTKAGAMHIPIASNHQALLYLLHGEVSINKNTLLKEGANQCVQFNQDGEGFHLHAQEESMLLFLSGTPLDEPIVSWGPYVMNTQSEIMEALQDYQSGKMGYLSRD